MEMLYRLITVIKMKKAIETKRGHVKDTIYSQVVWRMKFNKCITWKWVLVSDENMMLKRKQHSVSEYHWFVCHVQTYIWVDFANAITHIHTNTHIPIVIFIETSSTKFINLPFIARGRIHDSVSISQTLKTLNVCQIPYIHTSILQSHYIDAAYLNAYLHNNSM